MTWVYNKTAQLTETDVCGPDTKYSRAMSTIVQGAAIEPLAKKLKLNIKPKPPKV